MASLAAFCDRKGELFGRKAAGMVPSFYKKHSQKIGIRKKNRKNKKMSIDFSSQRIFARLEFKPVTEACVCMCVASLSTVRVTKNICIELHP